MARSRRGNAYVHRPESGNVTTLGPLARLPRLKKDVAEGPLLMFPRRDIAEDQIIKVAFLKPFGELVDAFSSALLDCLVSKSPATRLETTAELKRGFFSFLETTLSSDRMEVFSVSDISTELINHFVLWLDQVHPATQQARWSPASRMAKLTALTSVLRELGKGSNVERATPDVDYPKSPWPNRHRLIIPTEIIQSEDFVKLYRACLKEVTEAEHDLKEARRLISANRDRARTSDYNKLKELGQLLAVLNDLFPEIIPCNASLRRLNKHLHTATMQHGINAVRRLFHPTARQLIPIVLLLTIYFDYNPETILTISENDFQFTKVFGAERIRGTPFKGRSQRRQIRSHLVTEDPGNPAVLLKLVQSWTERLRSVADPDQANRLFLFVTERTDDGVQTFKTRQEDKGDNRWNLGLADFRRRHGLAPFTLKQVRHTGHDHAHELFAGDLRMVAAIGGQRSAQVINDHYTSASARERNWERLAEAQLLHAREREMGMRLDAAKEREEKGDIGAATPGWSCLDPLDSPMPGEVSGRLCRAYGRCPICPHAQLNLQSSVACSRAFDLLARIDDTLSTVSPESFLLRWEPIRERLVNHWIPRFASEVVEAARDVPVRRMPPLE